jgi:hypothetical protein
MNRSACLASILAACGTTAVASDIRHDTALYPDPSDTRVMGHLYINASTGERIITRSADAGVQGARGQSTGPVWIASGNPCGGSAPLVAADRPNLDPADPEFPIATGALFLDWGDIPSDTVVDAFSTIFYAQHSVANEGDGVPGLGATWSWYDADDGFNDQDAMILASYTASDLPGNSGQFGFEVYEIYIDLAGGPGGDHSFEIGDSDGDPQGAASHNANSATAPLHDFAHAVTFHQPGTFDFDGDGSPDGDPANRAEVGFQLAGPSGPVVPDPNSPGDFIIDPVNPLPSAQGLEDAYDLYINADRDQFFATRGGDFSCDPFIPFASIHHVLYGPAGATTNPCPADLAPAGGDGVLNFSDVLAFLGLFNSQDPGADLTDDGAINFNDVIAFLNAFNAGCP